MAASLVTTTTEFLQGCHRQKLFFQKHCTSQRGQLLWGTLHSQNRSSRFFNEEHVSLRRSSGKKKPRVVVLGTSITEDSRQGGEASSEHVIHFYGIPLIRESVTSEFLKLVQTRISSQIVGLKTEQCFNISLDSELSSKKLSVLKWLIQETCQPENLGSESFLAEDKNDGSYTIIVEIVPRLSVTTAWSANAASICKAYGLEEVKHLVRSRRYLLYVRPGNGALQDSEIDEFAAMVHDQITECVYIQKQASFKTSVVSEEIQKVRAMDTGVVFDEQDNQYYSRLFRDAIRQNPTAVKLFDIAQSNSEHFRPWSTLQANPRNSVTGFMDNSKAIKGLPVEQLRLVQPGSTCPLETAARDLDILCTTGTHKFPYAVAPYSAAASGHMRDTHATTGGGYCIAASTAGCGVGNLGLNNSYAPCEDLLSFQYPSNRAFPLQIFNDASNAWEDPSCPPPSAVDLETEEGLCGEMPEECSDFYHFDAGEPLDVARGEVVVMAAPKKRTSKSKTRIRRNYWLRKGKKAALYAFSLAKSISTGRSKSFMLSK